MDNFYQKYYKWYHERTFNIDPSSFLEPVVKALPEKASLLDVGCGSGRDLIWLKAQGFNVCGFEKSQGLARLARENSGCEVIEGDFELFDFSTLSFDAILASGSLVHVPHEKLPTVLGNIIECLPPIDSHVYISLKHGSGTKTDAKGRTFYLWTNEELDKIHKNMDLEVIEFSKSVSLANSKDTWLGYVLKRGRGIGSGVRGY